MAIGAVRSPLCQHLGMGNMTVGCSYDGILGGTNYEFGVTERTVGICNHPWRADIWRSAGPSKFPPEIKQCPKITLELCRTYGCGVLPPNDVVKLPFVFATTRYARFDC